MISKQYLEDHQERANQILDAIKYFQNKFEDQMQNAYGIYNELPKYKHESLYNAEICQMAIKRLIIKYKRFTNGI